ncbi:MAG TPA: AAC(3) family N-acetyltransferase [Alphaproteobacteria bacterium]|nr:AAC(3) family N-acetyltransferase [Alphaproteobacteria bacterium]
MDQGTFILPVRKWFKGHLRAWRRQWNSTFHSFSPSDVTAALRSLGVKPGDVVFAHVSYDSFVGFTGGPLDVLSSLRQAVSTTGTLMMPSIPFEGLAQDYVRSGRTFDVRRTPSLAGLVTELYRRAPGTARSLHPTHPVLACGPNADELLRDHMRARTPCGEHSPFADLADAGAKIVLLGTGIDVLTYYHYLEEVLEDTLPRSPFTKETFDVVFRGYSGETLHVVTRLYDAELSRRRDLSVLESELKQQAEWRKLRVGRLRVVVLEVREVSHAVRALAERGTYCYV